MRIQIYKTEEAAKRGAQNQALNNSHLIIEETRPSDWLIKKGSCTCACGESIAVEATYFDKSGTQRTGKAGVCDACGQD